MFTDEHFHSFIKYLSPAYYVSSAKLGTGGSKRSKTEHLPSGRRLAAAGREGILEPQGSGAPRGAARTAGAPWRKPGYLQPAGVPGGTCQSGERCSVGPRGPSASQHQVGSGSGESSSPERVRRRRQPKSCSLPALRFSSRSENRPRPALRRELPQEGGGWVWGDAGGAGGRKANRRLCLHTPSCSLPPGQHPVAGIDGFIFPRRKRTNAVDNCSGTADK